MASTARLIVDRGRSGTWNMAADQWLLTQPDTAPTTLRFYTWKEPTLSLGYFQALADRELHSASHSCPLVRRASGGGAIVHDREWTYSLRIRAPRQVRHAVDSLYDLMHQSVLATCQTWGVKLSLCDKPRQEKPFLCFQRRSLGDVLCDTHKVGGSAQRRNRNQVLQHGSLLLRQSAAAPELPGIEDLTGVTLPRLESEEFIQVWQGHLADALGVRWQPIPWTDDEVRAIRQIEDERFAASKWSQLR